jgi:hypothetical protein
VLTTLLGPFAFSSRIGSRVWPHAVHAILLPFAALSLQLWLDSHGRSIPFLLLYPAGLVSACLGGLRWGAAANLLSTGLAWYHLLPRITSVEPWMVWAVAFSTLGVLISMVRHRSVHAEGCKRS